MRTARILLNGLGQVGQHFLGLLESQALHLGARHGLALRLVAAADSGGTVVDAAGLDPLRLRTHKAARNSVAGLPGGRSGGSLLELLEDVDLVLEAAPTNLETGQPGLALVEAALEQGLPVVLASKGPLVVGWPRLSVLSDWRDPERPALRFSGAVGGGLPSLNMGWRDLAGARIQRVEAVLNLTNQLLLARMADGLSLEAAMGEAKAAGVLEADPSLDVDGWDAAAKILILARSVLGHDAALPEVVRQGLGSVPADLPARLRAEERRLVFLQTAELQDGRWHLSVGPQALEADHPFATLRPDEAAVRYASDSLGLMEARWAGSGPLGTAAAMLRDTVEILGRCHPSRLR